MTLSIYGVKSTFNFYVDHDGSITISCESNNGDLNDVIYLNKDQFKTLVNFINESINDVNPKFKQD